MHRFMSGWFQLGITFRSILLWGELEWRKFNWKQTPLIVSILLLLLLHFHCASCEQGDVVIVKQPDYEALEALKHAFVDLRGVLSSWNQSAAWACSSWDGIKCVNGQVIAICLPWKGLGGQISEKIGHLKGLRRLSLHDNALQGPVPLSLGLLANLRVVYLFNNRLSGSIPPSIGNCPVLQTLDLSNNQLTGFIPPSVANSTRLYRLNLSFNQISGTIPASLTQSSSLTFLILQHNNISGSIPDQWGSKSGNISYKLQSLLLDHNLVSGRIPSSLSKLAMLEVIDLSHNQILGSLPDELGNLSRLSSLDLSNNNLDSQILESFGKLTNLSVLNLSSNKFQGLIPLSIGNVTGITSIDLSENNLTGEIPYSLVNLQNLSSLDLSYNNLTGPVPTLLTKKFNSSSFVGNLKLCGFSSTTSCSSSISSNVVPPSSQQEPDHHSRKLDAKDIILIAAGALLIALLLLCCVLLGCLIRKKAASKARHGKRGGLMGRNIKPLAAVGTEVESGGETGGKLVHFDGPFVFTADDLLCATAEIMGKSMYGTAYKATLEDNNQVAVKRLREKLTKGQKEFETEVAQLGKIRHLNILALRAYYLGPKGEKLLVYDYMSNGSLASFLHARGPETSIPWPQRMAIVMGITRGLCYLHSDKNIVHGNLTSSSILLDEQNNPKIADVGLSHLMTSAANTDAVATAGIMGYRAPELSKLKNASTKTDVYSLGLIMLELLTGKSPSEATDGLDLPQWVASIVKEEWTNEVFDEELLTDATNIGEELLNTLKLALHCVDPSPASRPEAQQVAQKLQEIKPGHRDDDALLVPAEETAEAARD